MPCFFMACFNRMWFSRMQLQLTSTPAAVRSTSHQNTVKASLLRVRKLSDMKAENSSTHMYGVPQDVVRKNSLGAWPFSARPYSTRVPDSKAWFDALHADVMTMALTTLGMAGMPAALAAMTKGLCAAVPLSSPSLGSLLATSMPTTSTASM